MADIIRKVTEILNGREELIIPPVLYKWKEIYFNTSVHTTGVCPSYYPLRWENNVWVQGTALNYPVYWIYPEYDVVFDRLFSAHPREPQITREWRKSQYKPYQKAPLLQTMDKIKAVISAENKYTLFVDDKEDNDYIWGDSFDGKNLVDYVFERFNSICEDPNSLFIVTTDKPSAELKNGKVGVRIIHIPTRFMYYYSPYEVMFYETDAMDMMWYVNGNSYLRFTKTAKGWEQADGRKGYYAHMLGRVPCHFAGGIWNNLGWFDSYISPAIPFCDDFVGALSAVQMVNKEASHPFIIASSEDCPDCNAQGVEQFCTSCNTLTKNGCGCNNPANFKLRTCNSCHGTKVQTWNPADWKIVPKSELGKPHIEIVNPEVSINEFLDKYKNNLYEGIRAALHQQTINEAQSGTAKEIDRQGEMLYYQTVSHGIWSLINKLLIDILSIRNISKANGQIKPNIPKYTLIQPTEFDLKTEFDLLEEYKESTDAGMPSYIRQRQSETYVDKIYGGDEVMVKKATIINYLDPYSVTSAADKQLAITSGVASADDIRFSANLPNILSRIVGQRGKEWFINASYDTIEAEAKAMFAAMPAPKAPAPTSTVVRENV